MVTCVDVTSLVGLTLAALGAEVVVSELPAAVPLLEHNITSNANILEGGSCQAITLSWGEEGGEIAELLKARPFDMVVGADIIYNDDLFPPLKHTINHVKECLMSHVCIGSHPSLYICHKVCGVGAELYLCRLQRGTDPSKSQRFYDELSEFHIHMKRIVEGGARNDNVEVSEHEVLFAKYRELADQNQTLSFELLWGRRDAL